MNISPRFGQFSTNRSGEHGLAELLDNIRDAGQTGLGGLHLSQQFIEPVGNLFLLCQWRDWQLKLFKFFACYSLSSRPG